MKSEEIDLLILKKISKDILSEELIKIDAWISASEENQLYFNHLSNVLKRVDYQIDQTPDIDTEWLKLQDAIDQQKVPNLNYRKVVSLVAIFIGLIIVTGIIFTTNNSNVLAKNENKPKNESSKTPKQEIKQEKNKINQEEIAHLKQVTKAEIPISKDFVKTGTLEHEFALEDGTNVFLEQNSNLSFKNFNAGGKRTVFLEGGALLNVTKNKGIFELNTSKLKINVLGTIFGVYEDEVNTAIDIYVIEGKVKVTSLTDSKNNIIINKGEYFVYKTKKDKFKKKRLNFLNLKLLKIRNKAKNIF